jgi:hypothetical protein
MLNLLYLIINYFIDTKISYSVYYFNLLIRHERLQLQVIRKSDCQYVYRGTLGAICRPRNNRCPICSPPVRQPAIHKFQIVRKTTSQFVYRGTLDAICRQRNNTSTIFSPQPRQPGMKLPCMLYISTSSNHIFYFCRPRNNRSPIFSPPAREPAIQKFN